MTSPEFHLGVNEDNVWHPYRTFPWAQLFLVRPLLPAPKVSFSFPCSEDFSSMFTINQQPAQGDFYLATAAEASEACWQLVICLVLFSDGASFKPSCLSKSSVWVKSVLLNLVFIQLIVTV